MQPSPGWPAIPTPSGPYGHIVANSIPDGAEVYLDGKPVFDSIGRVTTTPVTILGISTGIHRITFRKTGYIDENVDTLIQNGLYSDAYAILKQTAIQSYVQPYTQSYNIGPRPRLRGRKGRDIVLESKELISVSEVSINSSPPGAYIYIDGVPLVDTNGHAILTPTAVTGIAEGLHEIILALDGYYDKQIIVDVSSNKINNVFAVLQPI